EGLLGGGLGAVVVLQPLLGQRGHLREEASLLEIAFDRIDFLDDELDRGAGVAARGVGGAEGDSGAPVLRVGVEGELVALDGAIAIATALEEASGADELFGLGLGRGGLLGEGLDRGEGGLRIARELTQPRDRLERVRVIRLDLEHLLVGLHGPLGRADLVGEDATELEEQLDAASILGDDAEVPLVDGDDVFPAPERTVMTRELREGRLVRGVDREDLLAGLGGHAVVEELLVVDAGDALEQVDLLARRRGGRDLPIENAEQLAVLAGAAVDAVEALERFDVTRVDLEDGLVTAKGLVRVAEAILVDLRDAGERVEL